MLKQNFAHSSFEDHLMRTSQNLYPVVVITAFTVSDERMGEAVRVADFAPVMAVSGANNEFYVHFCLSLEVKNV